MPRYQLRETRFAESLLNNAVTFERRSVESVTGRSSSLQPSCSDQARTVNQPRCEDWDLKCRRIGLPVGRQCPIDQHAATRREMPRNRRFGPAADAIDRPRCRLSVASCRELRAPIIVLAGDHYFTTKWLDVWNLRATAHDIDCAEAFRTSELQHKLAHRRTGGGLDQPVARFKIVLDHGHHPGCNRIHQSLRGALVREIARQGYDPFRWTHDEFAPRTPNVQKNDARAKCGTCTARPKRLDDTDALDAGTGW